MRPMVRWDPFRGETLFPDLLREFVEPLVRGRGEAMERLLGERGGALWAPDVNITETPEAYEIEAELPGCKPEDVKITLHGDRLTIHGEKRSEERREDESRRIRERSYGMFERSFTFPTAVDAGNVEAELDAGVLCVKVRKAQQEQPRQIEVRTGRREVETTAQPKLERREEAQPRGQGKGESAGKGEAQQGKGEAQGKGETQGKGKNIDIKGK